MRGAAAAAPRSFFKRSAAGYWPAHCTLVTLVGGPSPPPLRHTPSTAPSLQAPTVLGSAQKQSAASAVHAAMMAGSSFVGCSEPAQALQQPVVHSGKETSGALLGVAWSTSPTMQTGLP